MSTVLTQKILEIDQGGLYYIYLFIIIIIILFSFPIIPTNQLEAIISKYHEEIE